MNEQRSCAVFWRSPVSVHNPNAAVTAMMQSRLEDKRMYRATASILSAIIVLAGSQVRGEETLNLWPGQPPGEARSLPPESDIYKPTDEKIAGRKIIKLANVSTPTIQVHRPSAEIDSGTAVVICPGGGHYILAYDLEGTEVAEWLTSIGVTGVVLKYRVPTPNPDSLLDWREAVQDAQRAVSFVRIRAKAWKIDPQRIGILGFSAGGETAGLTALFENERTYEPIDEADRTPCRPDFAVLVYPGGFVDEQGRLRQYVNVRPTTPPMFLVHACDDSPMDSIALFTELVKAGTPSELHVYSAGGHGFGLRSTKFPVTSWPARCREWMQHAKLLRPGQ